MPTRAAVEPRTDVEIVVIGDEILDGDVLDTNSHWLCVQLTGLGARVRRVCQVRDDPAAIQSAVRTALDTRPRLIVTTGGLGPTEDDRTLGCLGAELGRRLTCDPAALEMVRNRYAELTRQGYVESSELTPARAKMADLPTASRALANAVGTAPGVLITEGEVTIVALPGVPGEMKSIFQGSLGPTLVSLLGSGAFVQWLARLACGDESVLSPIVCSVGREHPDVYVKSRAGGFGPEREFRVTLSARSTTPAGAEARVSSAWESLKKALEGAHIDVIGMNRSR